MKSWGDPRTWSSDLRERLAPRDAVAMAPAVRKRPRKAGMNGTEGEYARTLETLRLAGEIVAWRFEAVTFNLDEETKYTPDFMVVGKSGIEFHEVKGGHVWEDSRIKWKWARDAWPWFTWVWARKRRGAWERGEGGHGKW